MNVALDTNAYSAFVRGEPSRINVVRSASQIFMPLFVLPEVLIQRNSPKESRT